MAYSKVTIPGTFPAYNGAEYPYCVYVYNYKKGEEDWYQVHRFISSTAFIFDGYAVTTDVAQHVVTDGYQTGTVTEKVRPVITSGLDGNVFQRIFTTRDILTEKGHVWLAEGSVTPADEIEITAEWIESFKLGLALGLCGKSLYIPVVPPAYVWDENTGQLIVNRDNGSLHFEFDQNTFNMTVIQQY